jgi:type IV secretory pathway TraG/TraD family ATPase VirD4
MSNASVNTVYAGESGPNNDENLKTGMLIATIIVAVALPILSLSAVATWITFSWLSIRRSVIMAFLGIYTIGLLIASIFVNLIDLFITSWTVNVPALFTSGGEGILGQVLVIVGKQAPLSIFFGVLIGVLYASFFWSFRKAEWEEVTFKLTPWEWARKRKTINDIEENKNIPHNGVTLGISELTGKRIIQTDEEGSAHTAYFGASGSGKTTTMMMTCRDIIQREHGLVFVDLKGDPKVAKKLQEFAEKEGRVFRHWSMQSIHAEYTGPSELGPAYYDPIARGEA